MATPTALRPNDLQARLTRNGVPLAVVALLTLAALASVAAVSPLPFAVAAGVVLIASCARWPRVGAIAVMFLWAGPFATQLASRRIGGMNVDLADVIALTVFIAHAYCCWRDRRPLVRRPTSLLFVAPIAIWLVAAVIAIARGVAMGNALGTAADGLMAMSALSAYLVLRIAYARRLRTFAGDIVGVAVVGCLILVVLAVTGLAQQAGVVVDTYFTRGAQDQSLRIDAPALRLGILAVLLVVAGIFPYRSPSRLHKLLLLAPLVAGFGMSLTRSTWLPLIAAGVVIPAFLSRGVQIPWSMARRGVVTVLALVLSIGVASTGVLGTYAQGIATRFLSAGDADVLLDDSYQQRLVENEKAFLRIAEEPVWGIGFPRPYGAYIPYWPEWLTIPVFVERDFIHNSYLGVVMFFGLPGVFAALVLTISLLTLVRATAMAPMWHRGVPLACLGTLAVLAAMSTLQTQLVYEPFYLSLAVVFALADVWRSSPVVTSTAHQRVHSRGWPAHSPQTVDYRPG